MKKTVFKLLGAVLCLAVQYTYAQNDVPNRKDFLKNYKAPEFSYRALGVSFRSRVSTLKVSDLKGRSITGNFRLNYRGYSNKKYKQTSLRSELGDEFSHTMNNGSDPNFFFLNNRADFTLVHSNYYFLKSRPFFLGLHGNLNEDFNTTMASNESALHKSNLRVNQAVGIGYGRLEPVSYARSAMDIERLLNRGDVLTRNYTTDELIILADCIAEINNVRFYDFRLRRIEQFEALDKVMQSFGNLKAADMRYFATLADSYLYANVFSRYSGVRYEVGVSGGYDRDDAGNNLGLLRSELRAMGYARVDWRIPQSYLIQHRVSGLLIGGSRMVTSEFGDSNSSPVYGHAGYELSLYPNTRTHFWFGAYGVSGVADEFMVSAQFTTGGEIYFSPRLRASYGVHYRVGNGSNRLREIGHLYTMRNNINGIDGYGLSFNAGLSFAIF